jgi:hypothetical protein
LDRPAVRERASAIRGTRPAAVTADGRKSGLSRADDTEVNLDELPTWAEPVTDPFRGDPAFWRAVYASADALVLIVVAGLVSYVLGRLGAGTVLAMAPFVLPAVFVAWAVSSSLRSSRVTQVWFRRLDAEGLATRRDSERRAVASVFLHAVVRNRLQHP